MLIINADDYGGWESATNAALEGFKHRRISSVTAMVYMADSERAAALAKEAGMSVGLHLNLDTPFTSNDCPEELRSLQGPVRRWLRFNKYAQVIYNPFIQSNIEKLYETQISEFKRLYGRGPSHIDGHHHLHLCANMLGGKVIPFREKIRQCFSFWPGEKNFINRLYRKRVAKQIASRYITTEYFFALSQCFKPERLARIEELAIISNVEIMTHPEHAQEYNWLMSDYAKITFSKLKLGSFDQLKPI